MKPHHSFTWQVGPAPWMEAKMRRWAIRGTRRYGQRSRRRRMERAGAAIEVQMFGKNISGIIAPPEWTMKDENRFLRMAKAKALNRLTHESKIEFEKLSELRRRVKNPRSGEEVILEYEQRMITRDLVMALSKYVRFHNATDRPR